MPACNKCGLLIIFKKVGKKWHPTNPDGSDHYDMCKETMTDKLIKESKPFADKDGSGYLHKGKKIYHMKTTGFITGENYKPDADTGIEPF